MIPFSSIIGYCIIINTGHFVFRSSNNITFIIYCLPYAKKGCVRSNRTQSHNLSLTALKPSSYDSWLSVNVSRKATIAFSSSLDRPRFPNSSIFTFMSTSGAGHSPHAFPTVTQNTHPAPAGLSSTPDISFFDPAII